MNRVRNGFAVVAVMSVLLLPVQALADGTMSCAETLACVLECTEGDAACASTCMQQGTADAKVKYLDLSTCLMTECPGNPPAAVCVLQSGLGACKAPYQACVLGGGGPCTADCTGKVCGDDGCGGSCGHCEVAFTCTEGACVNDNCNANCINKECGDDGCGGTCGTCPFNYDCKTGKCVPNDCQPNCLGKECGDNGCGGGCGACGQGWWCSGGLCIEGDPPADVVTDEDVGTPQADTVSPSTDTGSDNNNNNNNNNGNGACPAGQKPYFGQCIDDPDSGGGDGGDGGCNATHAQSSSTLFLLFLLSLGVLAARRSTLFRVS